MKIVETRLNDIQVISLDCHEDDRGFFMEIYNQETFQQLGISTSFVQDNSSFSLKKGTIRGLHFQKPPYAQGKLIRCIQGSFYDLAVDVRKNSPTYGKASSILLKANDQKLVWIPRGFAHGVATLEDNSEYTYKVDNVYNSKPENNGGLSYAYDPSQLDFEVLLPSIPLILSDRDTQGVSKDMAHLESGFVYGENC